MSALQDFLVLDKIRASLIVTLHLYFTIVALFRVISSTFSLGTNVKLNLFQKGVGFPFSCILQLTKPIHSYVQGTNLIIAPICLRIYVIISGIMVIQNAMAIISISSLVELPNMY